MLRGAITMLMFDLHCHCLFSDGELIPAELVRRLEIMNYKAVAITDHADSSNIDFIIPRMVKAAEDINRYSPTKLIPGIELTHVHPELIAPLTQQARELGARIVVCHGETIVEPVIPGTNRAAIMAGVDILAHPGLIAPDDVISAAEKGVRLEISGRKGHSLTNGHVARLAQQHGAMLTINSDGHAPGDFMTAEFARQAGHGAGISAVDVERLYENVWEWLKTLLH